MKKILIITVILLSILVFSCSGKKGTVVAKVNEHVLTLEELQESYPSIEWNAMTNEQKRELINKWVDLTLLADKADEDDYLSNNPVLEFKIKNAEKKVKANAYIAQQIASLKVSDEELFNYYRVHQGEFNKTVQSLKVQRIFLKTQDEANRIKGLIDAGTLKFTPAAIQYSQEEFGKLGGYMTDPVTEINEKEIWTALNTQQQYQSVVIPYKDGFLIARYIESSSSQQEGTFDDVKKDIEKAILQTKKNEIYKKIIEDIKKESNITISF